MYVCACVHVRMHAHMCICVCARTENSTHLCIYACVCVSLCTYTFCYQQVAIFKHTGALLTPVASILSGVALVLHTLDALRESSRIALLAVGVELVSQAVACPKRQPAPEELAKPGCQKNLRMLHSGTSTPAHAQSFGQTSF